MLRYSIIFMLLWVFAGCNGGPEISKEEKEKRRFVAKERRKAEEYVQARKFDEAYDALKGILDNYPNYHLTYKYLAEVAIAKYRLEQRRDKPDESTYLYALENIKKYFNKLGPKDGEARAEALVMAGNILHDTFAYIPVKMYKEALDQAQALEEKIKGEGTESASYFRGCMALYQFNLIKAKRLFQGAGSLAAGELLSKIRKLEKNRPTSNYGKRLVFRKKMTKGDAAAFYYHEMKNRKLNSRVPLKYIPGDDVPDINSYWAREEILFCLEKGLIDLGGGNRFWPKSQMNRIRMALLVTNTLIIANNDRSIKAKHRSNDNPFKDSLKDFGEDQLIYAVVSWKEGYMNVGQDKKFFPQYPVSGIEFITILNKLKKKVEKK